MQEKKKEDDDTICFTILIYLQGQTVKTKRACICRTDIRSFLVSEQRYTSVETQKYKCGPAPPSDASPPQDLD